MPTYRDAVDAQLRAIDENTSLFLVQVERRYQLWGTRGNLHPLPKPDVLVIPRHYWPMNIKSVASILAKIETAGMTPTIFPDGSLSTHPLSLGIVIECFGFNPETIAPTPFTQPKGVTRVVTFDFDGIDSANIETDPRNLLATALHGLPLDHQLTGAMGSQVHPHPTSRGTQRLNQQLDGRMGKQTEKTVFNAGADLQPHYSAQKNDIDVEVTKEVQVPSGGTKVDEPPVQEGAKTLLERYYHRGVGVTGTVGTFYHARKSGLSKPMGEIEDADLRTSQAWTEVQRSLHPMASALRPVAGLTGTVSTNGIFSGGLSFNSPMRETLSALGQHGLTAELLIRWQPPVDSPSEFGISHSRALTYLITVQHMAPADAVREINGLNGRQVLTLINLYAKGLRGHHLSDLKNTIEQTYPDFSFSSGEIYDVLEERVNRFHMSVEDAVASTKTLDLSQFRRFTVD